MDLAQPDIRPAQVDVVRHRAAEQHDILKHRCDAAAQYLLRFIDKGRPWAHLDIAGMAWADKPGATWDKGATGYGVRLLDRLIRDTAEG